LGGATDLDGARAMPTPDLHDVRDRADPDPASDAFRAPARPQTLDGPRLDAALDHSRAVATAVFGAPAERGFDVRYWEGTLEPGLRIPAPYTLVVNRRGALRRMLLPPSELSIVEAFLSGDMDVEGDLEAAMGLGDAVNARMRQPRALATMARHLLALPKHDVGMDVRPARAEHTVERVGRQHAKERDAKAVRYHYDVGNDFYALWLDERMVYSCAYFRSPSDTLDEAQRAKLDLVCRKLRLRPGDRFLDVGCGWGALIIHAARHYGVTALGITLSEPQAALARERVAAAGLSDRCTVEIRDYRDLLPDRIAAFDRIASVGMVEHVGDERLPDYFAALHGALAPGGVLLNHGIVSVGAARPRPRFDWIESRIWRRDAFTQQYVFPDTSLAPLSAVIAAAEGAGFETRDVESLREHYAMTLRRWLGRLLGHREEAVALAGERTYRTWRLYMTAAARAFTNGDINVAQTLLSKPTRDGTAGLPLTREDLLFAGRAAPA
jgi:cyclopropane-fatty-acyl-phospholipid synthase